MLEIHNVSKVYKEYNRETYALRNVTFDVKNGEFIAVTGPSGCGKSTLLNILAGLLAPAEGGIIYNNDKIDYNNSAQLQQYRCNHVGIILQNFSLLNDRTVGQNVSLPLDIRKIEKKQKNGMVREYLMRTGMIDKIDSFPQQLSGGQKQRVAIARALVYNPDIILADEPTGALDKDNAVQIIDILREIAEEGKIVIMVTHDMNMVSRCDRCITLKDGCIV